MIPLGGWPGRVILSSTGRFGVRPAEFAALGTADSPLLACVDPGDDDTEFAWVIRSLPSSGTLVANDDGGMSHSGAVDGSYTIPFGLYTWAPGGPGVYEGDTSFTTTFGAVILATETDTALALAAVQSRTAGMSVETDAALALSGVQARAVGLAVESSEALALAAVQRRDVGLAVETDQAFALEASAPGGVGVAVEADAAFALPGLQRRAVGLAVETDEAFALNVGTGGGAGATAAEIWNYVLADGRTAAETLLDNARMMRIILAGISGKTAGLGSDTETYFGEDGTTPRIVASFDSQGNRVSVTTDGAP